VSPSVAHRSALPIAVPATDALLSVRGLRVHFQTARGLVHAVDDVSYDVRRGEIAALVGESGSGKSVSALAIMRLLPRASAQVSGSVEFAGRDLLKLSALDMRAIRGRDVAMIFQEPMTSLNPVLSIGLQLAEPLQVHLGMDAHAARVRAIELLTQVGMTDPAHRLAQYPHHLSGGMRQRVMIAMALACNPKLIIADEPTTALDVTIQAQILDLLRDLSRRLGIALVVITHNLGIVARYADRVNVMYAARLVEQGAAGAMFAAPRHFYTLGLLRAIPRLDRPRTARLATIDGLPPDLTDLPLGCRFAPRCAARLPVCDEDAPLVALADDHRSACRRADTVALVAGKPDEPVGARVIADVPILAAENLSKHFGVVRAVDDVSFSIRTGETLGLVGESGCGKSTICRLAVGLEMPTAGRLIVDGRAISPDAVRDFRAFRHKVQMVFQDPASALNPRMTIGRFIAEPLLVHRLVSSRAAAQARVNELLDQVGLFAYMAERYPHELSGGQRQRVGVARALAVDPPTLLLDEPFGAVDPITRERLQLEFVRLQDTMHKTAVFVTHDVDEAIAVGDRIAVLRQGGVLEQHDTPVNVLERPASDFVAELFGLDRMRRLARLDAARRRALNAESSL